MSEIDVKPTVLEIQSWLVQKVSSIAGINAQSVSLDTPLSSYGLDSVHAIHLVGDINHWLNLELEPTLAWDYPTINALATHLISEVGE